MAMMDTRSLARVKVAAVKSYVTGRRPKVALVSAAALVGSHMPATTGVMV